MSSSSSHARQDVAPPTSLPKPSSTPLSVSSFAPPAPPAITTPNPTNAPTSTPTAASDDTIVDDEGEEVELATGFDLRTFDRTWVEMSSLMTNDGFKKIYHAKDKRFERIYKKKSLVPQILRDMGPPEGSVFDPERVWKVEKERRAKQIVDDKLAVEMEVLRIEGERMEGSLTQSELKKNLSKKEKEEKKNKKDAKLSTADIIRAKNTDRREQEFHGRDIQMMANNNSLTSLRMSVCTTDGGRLQRMLKMLDISVQGLKVGKVGMSKAEVFDILWALEEMEVFRKAENELREAKEKKKERKKREEEEKEKAKKEKKEAKKEGKDGNAEGTKKKDKKDEKKEKEEEAAKTELTEIAKTLKTLFESESFKDSLKYARKLMDSEASTSNLTTFQMTQMYDRLPPLSKYNQKFKLEAWQCDILEAIDRRQSAVVCAPTSSGKTLLSTYTCKSVKADGTVLFVLPSEVLVWQIAATYYQFFKGNVTICTNLIQFQDKEGRAQVYIGTPRALEIALTKARGIAGQEMVGKEREFSVLDGGFAFDYLVLDEVHTLNGPEGDALQRIIRAVQCPVLALSATIGNAKQMQGWFQEVLSEHLEIMEAPTEEVMLKEHFARFINLQRYVVAETTEVIDGVPVVSNELIKLHPVAAMTSARLKGEADLIAALSMTPVDMMDLWKKIHAIFPATALEDLDEPNNFFASVVDSTKRVTLPQTKLYETRLKARLGVLCDSYPDLYEQLRSSFNPPQLKKIDALDVTSQLYEVVSDLKKKDLLPAVAFQLSTFGAFQMFKTLLNSLEVEQNKKFPDYRRNLLEKAQEKAILRKIAAGKAEKGNDKEKEKEEEAKDGFEDASLADEDITRPHEHFVLSPAIKHLKLNEVQDIRTEMANAGEKIDINHALIRGLRRGIAIYTNEVGFACYRRQVQILAQKGRLAVVFSDEALAYGVNMPFRSCVFCGDMGPALTPLIAQQMQGRAGRRGMDVQGNVIYLGMEWSTIENLMLGQISQVTGSNPHYPIMHLQRAISKANDPRDDCFAHGAYIEPVGTTSKEKERRRRWAAMRANFSTSLINMSRSQNSTPSLDDFQMEQMAGRTLEQFCNDEEAGEYSELSKSIVEKLGFVDGDGYLAMDHNVCTMVWEMHVFLPEALHIVGCLDVLMDIFVEDQRRNGDSVGDQNLFMSSLLHIVDRVPCAEGALPLHEMLKVDVKPGSAKVVDDEARALWIDIEESIRLYHDRISILSIPDEEKEKMYLPLMRESNASSVYGADLDSGVYDMLSSKKKGFDATLPIHRRNEIKTRIFRFGSIIRLMNNHLQQPHGKYKSLDKFCNKCFTAVKYSMADIMNQVTNVADATDL